MRAMLRPLPLPEGIPGRLWLTAMPGRFEPLSSFLTSVEQAGATEIVCLASTDEISTRSPQYFEARRLGSLPVTVRDYPIPDYGLPEDVGTFADLISGLCADLCRGRRLIIHCVGGIGRTGLVARQLLMAFGQEPGSAGDQVLRAGAGPETPDQRRFCDTAVVSSPRP